MRLPLKPNRITFAIVAFILILFALKSYNNQNGHTRNHINDPLYNYEITSAIDFEYLASVVSNLNETGFTNYIVPNVVHYVRFEDHYVDFVMYVSIKSVLLNQQPDQIVIHCDCNQLRGKYWDLLAAENAISNVISVQKLDRPIKVFNQPLSSVYHASDIARIMILLEHGGIFLDNDVYIVKSLDQFRKYELSLGWPEGEFLGTQVITAHKDARFLKRWLQSYENNYKPEKWYYNAGERPTKEILEKQPSIIHRVREEFGVHMLVPFLYKENWPSTVWRSKFFAVHLLSRHRGYLAMEKGAPSLFDETNIQTYNRTFGSMARDVLFGTTDLITTPASDHS